MTPPLPDWASYAERIASASAAELDALEHELFGRKQGLLTFALRDVGQLPPEERKERASSLNDWKNRLTAAIEERRVGLTDASLGRLADDDRLDVTLDLPEAPRGHLHPIPEFIRLVEDVFGRMGFDVARGREVETEEFNFTLVNMPAEHPARDGQDTFWIRGDGDKNDQRRVLRTQTSPMQIRYMRAHTPPFRMICPGRVYRKDADATHSPMFHQFEGLYVDRGVTLGHMQAVMIAAMRELTSPDVEFRFRTSYFPFVEPGLEVDMRWRGKDEQSREGAWLEVVGCGMVHPQVLRNGGIDPKEWSGFAFGFGIERLLMIKHQIPDLRLFYEGKMEFLRQF